VFASGIPQPRRADGAPAEGHPSFRTHLVQGWAPDFIPKLAEDARAWIDAIVPVASAEGIRLARELARREGILAGISAGATLAGALRIAESAPEGSSILCMLPDTGERYLSTPLFDGIPVEMTDEEVEVSRSTPSYRFDGAAAAPARPTVGAGPTAEARARVEGALGDSEHAVVVFALQYCEFCWAVRRLFERLGVPHRVIDLDAGELAGGELGGAIRDALTERTGNTTLPQVFAGGDYVGGCTETLAAWSDGSLPRRLDALGVPYDRAARVDPAGFLPAWLHPR